MFVHKFTLVLNNIWFIFKIGLVDSDFAFFLYILYQAIFSGLVQISFTSEMIH